MTEQSSWLKAALAINEALKQESPEVQSSVRQMNQKIYPQTWEAIREQEKQAEDKQ